MGKLQPHDGQKVGAYGWLVNKSCDFGWDVLAHGCCLLVPMTEGTLWPAYAVTMLQETSTPSSYSSLQAYAPTVSAVLHRYPSAADGVLLPVCIWYRYYPKLQSCVPFTPVTGTRLLVAPGPTQQIVMKAMAQTLLTLTGGHQRQCSPSQQAWLDQYM